MKKKWLLGVCSIMLVVGNGATVKANGAEDYDPFVRAMDDWVNRFVASAPLGLNLERSVCTKTWQVDNKNRYILQLPMAGIPKDKVIIEVEGRRMNVKGTWAPKTLLSNNNEAMDERSYEFNLLLPADSNSEKIEADMENGLLTITIPKTTQTAVKTIRVK
ncbi:MAG: Hsp20/alpha crystallin family protein [Puniceicoccales bacterium]|jgi:HSP20 family protein|nr:Hsp20/alpha crystallin family protein [Puniceicoccales bacterium]